MYKAKRKDKLNRVSPEWKEKKELQKLQIKLKRYA